MANAIRFGVPDTFTLAIAGDGSSPTLKNLSANSRKLGGEIAATRYRESNWLLKVRGQSSFALTEYFDLYFVPKLNSLYTSGSDSVTPAIQHFVGRFWVPEAVSTQLYLMLTGVPLPNCPFKPFVLSGAGRALTNTNDENQLWYEFYDDAEVQ